MISRIATFGHVRNVTVTERKLGGFAETCAKFAHVTVAASPPAITSCIRALNGAVWGDAKLKVARANERYCDRILRESKEPAQLPKSTEIASGDGKDSKLTGLANVSLKPLKIKNPDRRGLPKVIVSLDTDLLSLNKIRFEPTFGEQAVPSAHVPRDTPAQRSAYSAQAQAAEDQLMSGQSISEENVRVILRQQGFLDSESDVEDEANGNQHGTDTTSMPTTVSHEMDIDVTAEKDASLDVLSRMFDHTPMGAKNTRESAGAAEETSASASRSGAPGDLVDNSMRWRAVARYDPRQDSSAELEEKILEHALTVRPTPMPEAATHVEYQVNESSLSNMFRNVDSSQQQESFSLFGATTTTENCGFDANAGEIDNVSSQTRTLDTAKGSDVVITLESKESVRLLHFSLLGRHPEAETEECRFMRTETTEELDEQWKAIRAQYTADYKRRRKDTLRKNRRSSNIHA